MKIGIDKIGFYAPHIYVDMNKLAVARNVEPEKFTIGIGQSQMAVAPVTQDSVSLAANAALEIIDDEDREKIDFVIFGSESGIDHSKSGAVYVHQLLGLNPHARAIEVKQACYGATAGIQMAKGHIALNPDSKVLVLGSDIARYGLKTSGESTQGAGAVAMIISANPRIMELEEHNVYLTNDIMDFWRPIYSDMAFVDGKFSNEQYILFFNKVWEAYKEKAGLQLSDMEAICFHLPYTKMGLKALRTVLDEASEDVQNRLLYNYQASTTYNRNVGNIYTGSLYLSLLSLLENKEELQDGARIGMYSYGSGAVGEFFSGILQPGFKKHLFVEAHQQLFARRKEVSVEEYEVIFEETLPKDGSDIELDITKDPAAICLSGTIDNKRQYVNKLR
ncbi:hydroxymethylglutaryl-CoA synthase [Ornithinibacillus bavariensis]|uniref:Hydroxymethylglutaryl-CoA synthase n=1 Tax=Ornithinibacillus bavariensis TaxID=545502 RepID=A0A920C4K5_9BACI|nr:hydroxymethylglutaryl-CoA synthase [Ornithinibacillus bavariensis]GIO25811.1 hydroxymethylglutaryl-CoA synthase [Ornithinibacillus bavariensis]HAM79778.1 hydroxymethylglutaryl-CoA synthase [Ornithinibacillus sp.]